MAGNTFGSIFRLTSFGESHGKAIGGIIDGCPAGLMIDIAAVQQELNRRRPGASSLVSTRSEEDKVEFLSGIYKGVTTGAPIAFLVYNRDQNPEDYAHLENIFRPSHADYTYYVKYGIRDPRGGGRASARETLARVVGGSIARQFLSQFRVSIIAYVSAIGEVAISESCVPVSPDQIESSLVRCPDKEASDKMVALIEKLKTEGDTIGGVITCRINGLKAGLGEPVFDKLHADLGKAMLSINAVKGFEIGSGFRAAAMKGSDHNDLYVSSSDQDVVGNPFSTYSNYSGGVQGGISTGNEIYFRVAFKPVSTIMKDQQGVDIQGKPVLIKGKGRHDVCVVPRAVPIVEAMAALTLADHWLRAEANSILH